MASEDVRKPAKVPWHCILVRVMYKSWSTSMLLSRVTGSADARGGAGRQLGDMACMDKTIPAVLINRTETLLLLSLHLPISFPISRTYMKCMQSFETKWGLGGSGAVGATPQ